MPIKMQIDRTQKKLPISYNSQNTNCTTQRKGIIAVGKTKSCIKQAHESNN